MQSSQHSPEENSRSIVLPLTHLWATAKSDVQSTLEEKNIHGIAICCALTELHELGYQIWDSNRTYSLGDQISHTETMRAELKALGFVTESGQPVRLPPIQLVHDTDLPKNPALTAP